MTQQVPVTAARPVLQRFGAGADGFDISPIGLVETSAREVT